MGIDIAKRRLAAAVRYGSGAKVGGTLELANDSEGFESLAASLREPGVGTDDSVVAMESTAHYWVVPCAWLDERSFGQAIVNPIFTERRPTRASGSG